MRPPHSQTAGEVLRAQGSDGGRGLTAAETARRRTRFGPNALPAPKSPSWARLLLLQFRSALVLLLVGAGIVSGAEWAAAPAPRETALPYEAIAICAILLVNAGLGAFQETRASRAVRALADLTAPQAAVLRDGTRQQIHARDLVPGDVLVVEAGNVVPADARLVEAADLSVDEAVLTGESAPVSKQTDMVLPATAAVGDRRNMLFTGTHVVRGRGRAVVTATGLHTEVGRIAALVSAARKERTPLEREMDRVGRRLGTAVLVLCALVLGIGIATGAGAEGGHSLLKWGMFAVALAVAAVPEALPAVVATGLAVGTRRMAARRAVVRRLPAVETMGAVTVICTDKTGTLTQNVMTVCALLLPDGSRAALTGAGHPAVPGSLCVNGCPVATLPAEMRRSVEKILRAGALANDAALIQETNGRWTGQGDPMEAALLAAFDNLEPEAAARARNRFERQHEVAFTSERKRHTTVHADAEQPDHWRVVVKGGVDIMLSRCSRRRAESGAIPLTTEQRERLQAAAETMGGEGVRVLALAEKVVPRTDANRGEIHTLAADYLERDLVFLGAVGLEDPPRPEAREAVSTARRAGIRTVMLTGDHPATATAIARAVGLQEQGGPGTVTGSDLDRLSEAELDQRLEAIAVYARVDPEHKMRVVKAWQRRGHIVAVTGDGVNDAPALRAADAGIAMGRAGTDVAREAADVVLTDDNFATIVAAIAEGRTAYANIRRYLLFLLGCNAGEILTVVAAGLLAPQLNGVVVGEGGPGIAAPLSAVQLLYMNLVTDGLPALALGVEPISASLMTRPPHRPGEPLLGPRTWRHILLTGIMMALGVAACLVAYRTWQPGTAATASHIRTLAFTLLVFFQLATALTYRSGPGAERGARALLRSRWLLLAVVVSALAQVAAVQFAPLQQALGTQGGLNATEWFGVGAASIGYLLVAEAVARRQR